MSDFPREEHARFEESPLTRSEYIQAMVHFYRGEMNRSNVWRQRLDNTTNWAVVTSAAIITFSFSEPSQTHLLLVVCNFLILGYLFIEARRFRYFSVYRARVRMLEENFILPIVTRNLVSPKPDWREFVAMDLDVPKFKSTLVESLALRVRYNYFWIFSTLFLAWLLKVWLHPEPSLSFAAFYEHMAAPPLPGWAVLAVAASFYLVMTLLFLQAGRVPATSEDEVHGYEADRSHWKL
ncbi:MAG: DUF2270 domain-containing protein [Acidobacteriota bacterium]|nr:DUF2270 domain-containing protein [Acidobacteriota bacterium]